MHTSVQGQSVLSAGALQAFSANESDNIRRKLGTTPIYVLRQTYGAGFAPEAPADVTLGEAMAWIDDSSIALLVRQLQRQGASGPT